ncbi:hypothetical protein ARMSODRAFT_950866 [Armillaria solidipes]|uniref:Uncharacterized protein n=1 Tax=Armillaria solidipes TaxID=1076256 RepID=A0A2H3C6F4_9AGAR|nr:hypothetical protein ARMSODRAFT_950866 [Armillaria solidipes]
MTLIHLRFPRCSLLYWMMRSEVRIVSFISLGGVTANSVQLASRVTAYADAPITVLGTTYSLVWILKKTVWRPDKSGRIS